MSGARPPPSQKYPAPPHLVRDRAAELPHGRHVREGSTRAEVADPEGALEREAPRHQLPASTEAVAWRSDRGEGIH